MTLDERADSEIVIRAVGPAVQEGRLPLAELARLAGEFQATLERIAMTLRGSTLSVGRRPSDVVNAVRLDLVGLEAGSAVLRMRPSEGALLDHALLAESMDVLVDGLQGIAVRSETVPSAFTPHVLDGLIRFTGGLSSRSIDHLELIWRDRDRVNLDREFRERARRLRRQHRSDVVTIVGRLHEGDFDPLALRCRIDTLDATVACSFTEDMRDAVLAAMDAMIVATGVAELQPDGRPRTLAIEDVTVIDEAKRRTVEELAREQGIEPVRDTSDFATLTDLNDAEFEDFVSDAMSARS